MKKLVLATLVVVALIFSAFAATAAAPNIYGTSGLIEVPDDVVYPVGGFAVAYHSIFDTSSNVSDETLNFFTMGMGIMPNLDVSGGVQTGNGTNAVLNAKYKVAPESQTRPSITVGVVDAAGQVSANGNPGIYVLLGKNLTAAAEEVYGHESKPLRGYFGFGTGALQGLFVGMDWSLGPKLSAQAEFLTSDQSFDDGSHFNVGLRYAITPEVKMDLSMIAFENFSADISYSALRF